MALRTPESTQPGPWEPFHGFRLSVPAEQGLPLDVFREELLARLDTHTFEFTFDEKGMLKIRARDGRPDVGRVVPGPSAVYSAIRDFFLLLGLTPPPPTYLSLPSDATEKVIEREREQIRTGVLTVLRTLGRKLWPGSFKNRPHEYAGEQQAPGAERQNTHAQFANLQGWWEQQWSDSKAFSAIEQLHRRRQDKERCRPLSQVLIPPGEELELHADGRRVRIQVSSRGDSATVEIPVSQGMRMAVTIDSPQTLFNVGATLALLRGVTLQLQRVGLAVGVELGPNAVTLLSSEDATRNCRVVWDLPSPEKSS